jgi:putative Holliday junction resolvase
VPIIDIEELARSLPAGRPVAAIDPGTTTIGLAVSDRSLAFANTRPVIMRKKFGVDAEALLKALARDEVHALAIGLPVNMDGSEGPRAQASRAFARNLAKLTDLPLLFWDERLSTVAAERTLIEMDFSRKARKTKIDSAAAAFILQGVLDRLRVLRRPPTE